MKAKTWNLRITQELIDHATPRNSRHCIVADAIRTQIYGAYSIAVKGEWVRFNVGDDKEITGTRYAYPLPGIALEAARLLDDERRDEVKPIKFSLDGREGFSSPVVKKGPYGEYSPRKRKNKRNNRTRRCAVRRYKGLSGVSKPAAKNQ